MAHVSKLTKRPTFVAFLLGVLMCMAVVGARNVGLLQRAELAAYDWLVRAKPRAQSADARIILLTITDADIAALGHWPMSDAALADIIERLLALKPRTIGFDLYRDLAVPPGTELLTHLLRENRQIVMAEKFGSGNEPAVAPPVVLGGTEQVGFADLMIDPGGVVRRALLFLDDGQRVGFSLPLRLVLNYLAIDGITPSPGEPDPSYLRLGDITLPPLTEDFGGYVNADVNGYQLLLDYDGGVQPFDAFTLADLRAGRIQNARDRIVLVGVAADSVKDLFLSPFSHDQAQMASIPGMFLHAHAARQFLRSALEQVPPIRVWEEGMEQAWIAIWAIIGAGLAVTLRALPRLVLAGLGVSLALGGGTYGAFLNGWWISVVPPFISMTASMVLVIAYLAGMERTDRRFLMEIFSKHVSNDVANEIWRQRDALLNDGRLEAREMTVSVLFSDLEDFTPIAERLSAREMMDWLNDYMESMAGLVIAHGGVVDDYYGDAIKANFGAPIASTTDAEIAADAARAVNCAVAMRAAMRELNERYAAQDLPPARMRVGIATGVVVAGCLGSAQRMKYTTIGDVVNTAARLQAYGKEIPGKRGPCTIVIAGETQQLLGDGPDVEFVGAVQLKGKASAVNAFRLVNLGDDFANVPAPH